MSVRTPALSLQKALHSCVDAVEGVAFWTSVLVPLTYPPLLAAAAIEYVPPWFVLAAVAVNAVALVVGHRHNRATDATAFDGGAD